jgi:ABC-2 type transport system permease protein
LLGAPVLVAYGLVAGAPWHYYIFLLLFFIGFTLLPGSLGALICLLIVNYVPRQRKTVLILAGVAVLIVIGIVVWQLLDASKQKSLDRDTASRLLNRLSFVRSVSIPTHWVANGLRSAARNGPDDLRHTCYYLALVWSNGLLVYVLTAWASSFLYRRGVDRIATGGSLRRRYGGSWLDRLLAPALVFVNPTTRLLLIKDFRCFRRDPAQWSQVLIFACLLAFASFNIGMYSADNPAVYSNIVSAVYPLLVGLLVMLYNARFIFPLLSLEGRKFWILGLLPIDRAQLIWGKFVFSVTTTLGLAVALIVFSDVMLGMPATIVFLHALTMAVLAIGLSGLSVGFGAYMADYRETNPAKIVAGVGGTLNQIAGLLFMVTAFALISGPWYVFTILDHENGFGVFAWATIILSATAGLIEGVVAVALPLRWGIQSLRQSEF